MRHATIWKAVLGLSLVMTLGACASTGTSDGQSSFSVNGMSYRSMDLYNPRFYMDDDSADAPFARDPRCC